MGAQHGEQLVAEICRMHAITQALFYKRNKELMEAGRKRLAGDTTREATSGEVTDLCKENQRLKEVVANLLLRYTIVKKLKHIGVSEKYCKYMRLTVTEKREIIWTVS